MQPRVAAILLAAGRSRRMGCCKQLLPLDGRPVIIHLLEGLLAAGPEEVIIVTGTTGMDIETAVSHLPVTVTRNPDPESDMAQSVRVGMGRVSSTASGVLVCLADTPLIESGTNRLLLHEHQRRPDKILIPSCHDRKGHPALIPRAIMADIDRQPTLKDVIRNNGQLLHLVAVDDPGVLEDMDTPEDYRRICARIKRPAPFPPA